VTSSGSRRVRGDDNLLDGLPTRPAKAGDGGKVKLLANYFSLNIRSNSKLYQYMIDFTPDLEASKLRQRLIYRKKSLGTIACDGQNLYSPVKIDNQEWDDTSSDNKEYHICIRCVKEIDPSEGTPYQLCNIFVKRLLREMKMVMMGRNYYTPEGKKDFSKL